MRRPSGALVTRSTHDRATIEAVSDTALRIEVDDLSRDEVLALLAEHLTDMHRISPAESVHALDVDALRKPGTIVWSAWIGADLAGIAALIELDASSAELKSMRTTPDVRGSGVGAAMLTHVLDAARASGRSSVVLETGSRDAFAPARRLYARHGFEPCPPFGVYVDDPESVFMRCEL